MFYIPQNLNFDRHHW